MNFFSKETEVLSCIFQYVLLVYFCYQRSDLDCFSEEKIYKVSFGYLIKFVLKEF